jgi:carbamoyl-phosphate synthase large subunit
MKDTQGFIDSGDKTAAKNVLITSASHKIPLLLAAKEALRRINPKAQVIAGDIDPSAPTRYIADDFWQMPRIADDILPEFINECHIRGIFIVLPTRNEELEFWSRHRTKLLEQGIYTIISDLHAIKRCYDKLAFANFGRTTGLPIIDAGITPESVGGEPYVVKERFGSGSRGVGLGLTLDAARAHAKTLDMPIYQPLVTGPEISIDGWLNQNGITIGVTLRRRDRVVSGESQVTTTFRNAAWEHEAGHAFAVLGLRGPVMMQAIIVAGDIRIIECNPRLGGTSTVSIAVGLDMLYWSFSEAFGYPDPIIFNRFAGEARQVRLPTDMVLYDPDL